MRHVGALRWEWVSLPYMRWRWRTARDRSLVFYIRDFVCANRARGVNELGVV
jgi:hypothetical protein